MQGTDQPQKSLISSLFSFPSVRRVFKSKSSAPPDPAHCSSSPSLEIVSARHRITPTSMLPPPPTQAQMDGMNMVPAPGAAAEAVDQEPHPGGQAPLVRIAPESMNGSVGELEYTHSVCNRTLGDGASPVSGTNAVPLRLGPTTAQAEGTDSSVGRLGSSLKPSANDGLSFSSSTNPTLSAVPSVFPSASDFNIENFNFVYHEASSKVEKGWELLVEKTAPNALHDSRSRFDPPKCDEDTRVEAIQEIMDWMEDQQTPQKILCMTGAAGAGKSALQQTISEKCAKKGILGATYFFWTGDSTRDNPYTVVPTIAYQLGTASEPLRSLIGAAVAKDPLIFSKSLRTQMQSLIVSPMKLLRIKDPPRWDAVPFAILIDGLDECRGEEQQAELLFTIKECILDDSDSPFRLFIASRPEWAMRSALEPGGYLHSVAYHIQLSEKYDATADIRRYLWRRLRDIGAKSSDRRAQSATWPHENVVDLLVRLATGQFIYAATVVKYISERRSSPVDRLQSVLKWELGCAEQQKSGPFSSLDTLYRNIVNSAKDAYEAVDTNKHDFLLVLRSYQLFSTSIWSPAVETKTLIGRFNLLLDLEEDTHELIIADLRSLVTLHEPKGISLSHIEFYHRSFFQFLSDKDRALALYVPPSRIWYNFLSCCLQRILKQPVDTPPSCMSDCWSLGDQCRQFEELVTIPLAAFGNGLAFREVVLDAPICKLLSTFAEDGGWEKLDKWFFIWMRHGPQSCFQVVHWIPIGFSSLIIQLLQDTEPGVTVPLREHMHKWQEDRLIGYTHGRVVEELKSAWPKRYPAHPFQHLLAIRNCPSSTEANEIESALNALTQ